MSRKISPAALERVGLWMIVGGLIAEAALIVLGLSVDFLSPKVDKIISAFCTVIIAVGVWIEHQGTVSAAKPRNLRSEEQRRLSSKMIDFAGTRAVLGAFPRSAPNVQLVEQILSALRAANIDAFINLAGVESSLYPSGQLADQAPPTGVVTYFIPGNKRGEAFARTLTSALEFEKIAASFIPHREHWATHILSQEESKKLDMTIDDKSFSFVQIVVGDIPFAT